MAIETYTSEDSVYHASVTSPDGKIKNYDMTKSMTFPCLILTPKGEFPRYRIQVLKAMLEELSFIQDKVPENYYYVYVDVGKKVLLGMVHSDKLRNFLHSDMFKNVEKVIYKTPTEKYEGVMVYSLCTSPLY